ncbi:class I SAM-dependent methyltransferase [Indioceanicola profundi]|uniref:class I SAM-dependent methyltransferase n=1 Tax=Indioceanicola profundi TaxID=2220096 RepID=UPI000E6AAC8B|nr:class I SAM-dependent methyltransferase [Indioceanicola profundi]
MGAELGTGNRAAERLAFVASQAARVGWYFGQYALAARMAGPTVDPADRPPGSYPSTSDVLAELRALLEQDWRNMEAGVYLPPDDILPDPRRVLANARAFFQDLPRVQQRREGKVGGEVFKQPVPGSERLPRYYRQNFHYQTGGYLTEESARLYDHQVEVLFGGGADAMRRRVLVPIAEHFRTRPVRGAKLLDVAAGTGRFLAAVKHNYPRLDVTALDLSRPYLAEAMRRLSAWSSARAVQAPAEAMPFPDASFDVVTSIYLFHELPRKVRAAAAEEMARVLKPGGLLVFEDSLQTGDRPKFDALLRLFPVAFHEPYYADYIRQDLRPLFTRHGLEPLGAPDLPFMSKVMAFRKPG